MSRQPIGFKITWSKVPLWSFQQLLYYMYVNKTKNAILIQGHRLSLLFRLDHIEISLTLKYGSVNNILIKASGGAFKQFTGSCRVRKKHHLHVSCEFHTEAKKES